MATDLEVVAISQLQSRHGTRPEYPEKLKAQAVPFNPNHPPAAFPSLPFTTQQPYQSPIHLPSLSETSADKAGPDAVEGRDAVSSSEERLATPTTSELITLDIDDDDGDSPDNNGSKDPQDLHCSGRRPSTLEDGVFGTEDYQTPSWNSLALSLQYLIYTSLSEKYSQGPLHAALGLTELEAKGIQEFVELRKNDSASLDEIWKDCVKNSDPVPGLPESQTCIAPEVLHASMDRMLFASNYEFAHEYEFHQAAAFLWYRSLPVDLLGTWIPDPDEQEDLKANSSLPKLQRMFRKRDDSKDKTQPDSGCSVASHGPNNSNKDRHQVGKGELSTVEEAVGDLSAVQEPQTPPNVGKVPKQPIRIKLKLKLPGPKVLKKAPAPKSAKKQSGPKAKKKQGRHPLATVTVPDPSPSPPRSVRKKTKTKNTAVKKKVKTRAATHRQGQTPCRPEASRENTSATSARAHTTTASLSDITTTYGQVARKSNFDPKMPLLGRRLLIGDSRGSIMASSRDEESAAVSTDHSQSRSSMLSKGQGPPPTNALKRRASQPNIRLSPPQVRRTSARLSLKTAPDSRIDTPVNVDLILAEAKKSQSLEVEQLRGTGDMDTSTKDNDVSMSIESPSGHAGFPHSVEENKANLPGSPIRPSYPPITAPGSPRTPSFSPIENAHLPEFQALLRGPGARKLRTRPPSFSPISENEHLPEYQALLRGPGARNLRVKAQDTKGGIKGYWTATSSLNKAQHDTPTADPEAKTEPIPKKSETPGSAEDLGDGTESDAPHDGGKEDLTPSKPTDKDKDESRDGTVIAETAAAAAGTRSRAKSLTTPPKKATPQPKSTPAKRAPRRSFRKTRERLERVEQAQKVSIKARLRSRKST
ncbi:hypothetical protein A1O1_00249 [Capronia coronata CBS 617.96]|uniref:Uncharacterized protein n=1 Tax=Capronia coronata CBS 617.96 TaxID=1182541 RepID=W9YZK9_9EURO|nr:uncharacterized protein A1O1_00249 [Capronia coronata CBS 617.96]EXJ95130.1 hypothetical protein A1O1_00249 [Capronia coronata CBS 617.96]